MYDFGISSSPQSILTGLPVLAEVSAASAILVTAMVILGKKNHYFYTKCARGLDTTLLFLLELFFERAGNGETKVPFCFF